MSHPYDLALISLHTTNTLPLARTDIIFTLMKTPDYASILSQLNKRDQSRLASATSQWLTSVAEKYKSRNRYYNVIPYDNNRVKLPSIDYINASHINISDNNYIACQGPLPHTHSHFWLMCFNQAELAGTNIIIIIMLTPLSESGTIKCSKYWPSLNKLFTFNDLVGNISFNDSTVKNISFNDSTVENISNDLTAKNISFNDLTVKNISEYYNGTYLLTKLSISSKSSPPKTVYHFFYDKWADSGVPTSIPELIQLSNHVNEIRYARDEFDGEKVLSKFGGEKGFSKFGGDKAFSKFGGEKGFSKFDGDKGFSKFGGEGAAGESVKNDVNKSFESGENGVEIGESDVGAGGDTSGESDGNGVSKISGGEGDISEENINATDFTSSKIIPIVHCSAGVGRTGTFIAIDHLMKNKGSDYLDIVDQMRNNRVLMVQTSRQLEFIHNFQKHLEEND